MDTTYESFEKSLATNKWWAKDNKNQDRLDSVDFVSLKKLGEDSLYCLSYSIAVSAGVELFIGQCRSELLAKLSQSSAFRFVELVAEAESCKALLFEAILEGSETLAAKTARCAENLMGHSAEVLLHCDFATLANSGQSFYLERFSRLSGMFQASGHASGVTTRIIESAGVSA